MNIKSLFGKIKKAPKKFLIIGAVIIVLGFILSPHKKPVVPQLAKARVMDLQQEVSASGIITGKNSADLKFKSGGKLSYVNVKVGEVVSAGTVIAGLDPTALQAALRIAQSNFRDKKATANQVHDSLNNVTTETFQQTALRTSAEVAQDDAYDAMISAQQAVNDATLFSPIDGVITSVNPVAGQTVTAADTIAHVADFSKTIFQADVDESDISNVKIGQIAEVTLNAYGDKTFKGKVADIVPQTRTTANGATVVTVKIEIDDPAVEHIEGLNGQANIVTAEKKHVLSVPIDAMVNDNTVFIPTATGTKKEKVTVGFKTDSDVEILSGLQEGDKVITNPSDFSQ